MRARSGSDRLSTTSQSSMVTNTSWVPGKIAQCSKNSIHILTGIRPRERGPSSGHSQAREGIIDVHYSYQIIPVNMCFITHLCLKCEIRTEIWKSCCSRFKSIREGAVTGHYFQRLVSAGYCSCKTVARDH